MLTLALAAAAVAAAVVVMVVIMVVVVMMVMLVVMVMVMMTAGNMVVMLMHNCSLLCIFFLLYLGKQVLSKHLFFPEYPPGGLAHRKKKEYNRQKSAHRKAGDPMSDHTHDHFHDQEHMLQHAHGIAHSHGHVHENQKAVVNRLARAIGHLEKVKRMVEDGYDCSDVLIQLAAVRSALDNTGKVILKDHMRHCMVDAVSAGDQDAIDDLCQAIDKFMK